MLLLQYKKKKDYFYCPHFLFFNCLVCFHLLYYTSRRSFIFSLCSVGPHWIGFLSDKTSLAQAAEYPHTLTFSQ